MRARSLLFALLFLLCSCTSYTYDVLIRGGTIYDGTGDAPIRADLGIRDDRIVAIGDLGEATTAELIDAEGMAVAPGFINVLSWAPTAILVDPRALSDLRQGVTLEIFGEGSSMGPLNPAMKKEMGSGQGDLEFDVAWESLGGYLDHLEDRGVAVNVASFVGAATLRIHELGYEDRAPNAEELARMQELAREAMREGALGLGSALIYAPGFYAQRDELVALAKAVGEFGGSYISHLRSEGNQFLEALEELIFIAREAGVHAEVYHLKAAGEENWPKLDAAIARIEAARAEGLDITADIYNYTAGATGLDAAMPPWVQAGGYLEWRSRLQDAETRERVMREMREPTDEWENLLLAAGGGEKVLLSGFRSEALKPLTGKTLAAVAEERGKSVEETAMDLVIEDGSRVECVYFLMSEENLRRKIQLPWVSFCSDASAMAPEGNFLKSNPHPRAYGNFAKLLGRYVRDEKLISMAEAVRRLSALPAENFKLQDRGMLREGYYADVVIFDPDDIRDHATYEKPHQLSEGVLDVLVNGVQVLRDGEFTGALPGRAVRGPGYR
ncbi:MAG: N-acyl-D-amino-acid deacylase family protein [Planctomycetota bacterium]|jgi:N-acyl-D-amino-acid deacylase